MDKKALIIYGSDANFAIVTDTFLLLAVFIRLIVMKEHEKERPGVMNLPGCSFFIVVRSLLLPYRDCGLKHRKR
ncbi:hypothetical protein AB4Z29_01875 [Paenibacillus sp. 2TAB23]|uniref:hypothetical protein n=1 Tax=Paenibacillus sp. 2TAB23 TaxID=3233004 RepID=UPI003F95CC5B